MPESSRHRRSVRILVIIAFFLLIALMIAKPIATHYVRSKLQQTLSSRLDGDLQLGPLSYSFPLGVHVGPSKIISVDPKGAQFEILGMDSFDLVLHESPFHSGPLIIERIAIGHPVIHVIQTDQGIVGIQAGVRHPATATDRPERKLSEVFQLRHVKFDSGEVQYEDRRSANSAPLILHGINLDFGTEPSSGAKYAFDLSTSAGQLATLKAKGEFNIDTFDIALADSLLSVHVAQDNTQSPLPAAIAEQLRKYNIKGDLAIATTASASLRNLNAATFDTKITLKSATAQLPDNGLKIDDASLTLECHRASDSPALALAFSTALRTTGASLTIEKASANIDPISQKFVLNQVNATIDFGDGLHGALPTTIAQTIDTLRPAGRVDITLAASGPLTNPSLDALKYEFAATAHDLTIKPPGFPQFLTAVNGAVRVGAGSITVENVAAQYGTDSLHITKASLPIERFDRSIHIKDIAADVVMRDPHPPYPQVLENIFASINPRGPIAIGGNVNVDSTTAESKVDYNLHITSNAAALNLTQYAVAITQLKSDLTLTPDKIVATKLEGNAFDGHITATGEVRGISTPNKLTYEFDATTVGIAIKPPGFPQPLTDVSGFVHARDGAISVDNLTAKFGTDSLHITSARMPLDSLDRIVHVKDITADIVMRDPHPQYPAAVENIFAVLNPRGPIAIAGDVTVDQSTGKAVVDYNLHVTSEAASLTLTQYAIAISHLKSDITLIPERITATTFDGAAFDGRLIATGEVLGKSPQTYQAKLALRGAELQKIVETFAPERKNDPKPTAGICFVNAELSGTINPPDSDTVSALKGKGDFEIVDGNFVDSKVLNAIASQSSVTSDALTVGHAAALFDIADRKVTLKNMAVSSPLLGVQGSGTVSFDSQLNLRLVAAPLADWKSQIKSTKIPIFSDVVGDVVGVAQKAINSATKKILYEFRVTGAVGNPKIDAVPAPALTEGAAKVFMGMVKAGKDMDLMGTLRGGKEDSRQ